MATGKMSYEYTKTSSAGSNNLSSNEIQPSTRPKSASYSEVRLKKDAYEHEERVKDSDHKHELALQEKRLGTLGRMFGADENSSKNITFVIIVMMLMIAIFLTYVRPETESNDDLIYKIWEKVFPIVTLSLGYIFGKQ